VRVALPPVLVSLGLLWGWLAYGPGSREPAPLRAVPLPADDAPTFDPWQTGKGLLVATALLVIFLVTDWPRDVAALVGAGVLLLSRQLHSARVMGFVNWQLLLLFIGLFVVNHAFASTGLAAEAVGWLSQNGVMLTHPGPLLVVGVVLSNLVSNVPAVMLLLPHLGAGGGSTDNVGILLALVSTFAGNLIVVGSIANLIVVDLARASGVNLHWRQHAAVGVPVTLASLCVVWAWLSWVR